MSWQAAAEQTEKRLWQLSGLAVAVAGAMLTHTYGLLVILPVGFGELIRSIRIKRLDWTVWLTLGLSSSAILVSVPLRQVFKSFLGTNLFPANRETTPVPLHRDQVWSRLLTFAAAVGLSWWAV